MQILFCFFFKFYIFLNIISNFTIVLINFPWSMSLLISVPILFVLIRQDKTTQSRVINNGTLRGNENGTCLLSYCTQNRSKTVVNVSFHRDFHIEDLWLLKLISIPISIKINQKLLYITCFVLLNSHNQIGNFLVIKTELSTVIKDR